jgi:hypothetical protein
LYSNNNTNWLIESVTFGIGAARFSRHGNAPPAMKNIKIAAVMNVKPKLLDQVRVKNPPEALQHPYRASLCALDPALHPVL